MVIQNKNIIWCLKSDIVLFWVHNLTQNKTIYTENEIYEVYYSSVYDVYFFYYKGNDNHSNEIINHILNLKNNLNNDVHVLLSDFRCVDVIIETLETIGHVKYSIVNHMGEMIYDTRPRSIKNLRNIKYYFSCSDIFNEHSVISDFQMTNKFIKDYKYSLIYFYFKLGFNFIEKGLFDTNLLLRQNKFFLYTKSKENSQRRELIDMVLSSNKIKQKDFSEKELFWFKLNNSTHHTSFLFDYNSCKFNIVMETQPLQKEKNNLSNFCSEKTLKSLIVSTPSYVVLQEDVFRDLKDYGFYFLNQEFGEYNYNNYTRFCEFLNVCKENEIDDLYQKSYQHSKFNKLKLEEYIFSDKVKEIKFLTNKQ